MARLERARAAAAVLGCATLFGCFDDLRDRACEASDPDCFPDEACIEGRCRAARAVDPDAAGAASVSLSVRVFERAHGTELPAATVDFDNNDGLQCSCLASATQGPCRLSVPSTGTVRVCARAHGYRGCARPELPTSLGEVELVLDACAEGAPCDDAPGTCTCAGLPTCGTTESP